MKITKLILTTLLSLTILFGSGIKREVKAETINNLSYAKGVNLLDPSNLELGDNMNVRTKKNVYIRNGKSDISIQIPESECNYYPIFYIELYDIDFNLIDTVVLEQRFCEYGNVSYAFNTIDLGEYDGVFSLFLEVSPIEPGILPEDLHLMLFGGYDMSEEFIEYESAVGIFDLSITNPTLEVEYDYSLSLDDIKELIGCTDGYDGTLMEYLEIDASDYLDNCETKGVYEVLLSVEDSNGNEQSGKFYISVIDTENPAIAGPDYLEISLYTDVTDEYILSNYTAIDEYDGDISSSIQIQTEYTAYPEEITVETIVLYVEDESLNGATKEIELRFFDNVAPVLNVPETLEYGYQVNMDVDTITENNVTISDNIDEEVTLEITLDEFTGNERRVGEYIIEYTATDGSGNKTVKQVKIIVSDTIKPVIFLDTYQIKTTSSVNLERLDFDNLLYSQGILSREKDYEATVLKDTYSGHENEEGNYVYQIKYENIEDDFELVKTFLINVDYDTYTINANAKKQKDIESIKETAVIMIVTVAVLSFGSLFIKKIKVLKKKK